MIELRWQQKINNKGKFLMLPFNGLLFRILTTILSLEPLWVLLKI